MYIGVLYNVTKLVNLSKNQNVDISILLSDGDEETMTV